MRALAFGGRLALRRANYSLCPGLSTAIRSILCIHAMFILDSRVMSTGNPPQTNLKPIKTPCIGVCSTGIGDSVCRGCKRFSHEVIHWNGYTQDEKRFVDQRLSKFLSQACAHKCTVIDRELLKWQLDTQLVRYNDEHDEYCWLFQLLKAGASQISDPSKYGFRVHPSWADLSLIELRDKIDEDFWVLSTAHYDRYLATRLEIRSTR